MSSIYIFSSHRPPEWKQLSTLLLLYKLDHKLDRYTCVYIYICIQVGPVLQVGGCVRLYSCGYKAADSNSEIRYFIPKRI